MHAVLIPIAVVAFLQSMTPPPPASDLVEFDLFGGLFGKKKKKRNAYTLKPKEINKMNREKEKQAYLSALASGQLAQLRETLTPNAPEDPSRYYTQAPQTPSVQPQSFQSPEYFQQSPQSQGYAPQPFYSGGSMSSPQYVPYQVPVPYVPPQLSQPSFNFSDPDLSVMIAEPGELLEPVSETSDLNFYS